MTARGVFPFGQPVRDVVQSDRSPKRAFVLGVYASAVHARWIGENDKTIISALAVASEPTIFWRGENAEAAIQQIDVPPKLGRLTPAQPSYNGPSGLALDHLILGPLRLARTDVWLCDLVPHSCMNPSQGKAIERAYLPIADEYDLPKYTVPSLPTKLTDVSRRQAIAHELRESGAEVLVLLGDKPIQWFLYFFDDRWRKLGDFGRTSRAYGRLHDVNIAGKELTVLPLAHPRQIAQLGRSSPIWYELHQAWLGEYAGEVAKTLDAG